MKIQAVLLIVWRRYSVWGGVCATLLSACADMEHLAWHLASSAKPAWMHIAGQRLEGEVRIRPDRTGAIRLTGTGDIASCAGSLRFTAIKSGEVDMRCSHGAMFDLRFAMVNEVKGYAFGTFQGATVALTFGMDAPEALAYLARAQFPEAAPLPAEKQSLTPLAVPLPTPPTESSEAEVWYQ